MMPADPDVRRVYDGDAYKRNPLTGSGSIRTGYLIGQGLPARTEVGVGAGVCRCRMRMVTSDSTHMPL
jgi:hypothetical protein